MKNILSILFLLIISQSCSIQGFTNDYKGLSTTNKEKIMPLTSFDNLDTSKIYTINAGQLKAELAKHPKSLVYVFTNGCTSDLCKPLIVYRFYAEQTNRKLFLVMNGFKDLEATFKQPFSSQLFAIDADYYGVKTRWIYTRYFANEIAGKPTKTKVSDKEYLGNLFFYTEGKLDSIINDLPLIPND